MRARDEELVYVLFFRWGFREWRGVERGLCIQAKCPVLLCLLRLGAHVRLRVACVCVREGGEEIKVLVVYVGSMWHGSVEVRGVLGSAGQCVWEEPVVLWWCLMLWEANIVLSGAWKIKLWEIQVYIWVHDRFRGVLYPRRIPSLFSSFAFLGNSPGKMHLLALLKKSHLRTAPCSTAGTSSRQKCVAPQWVPPILFHFLRADKYIWVKFLKRGEAFCVCMRAPKSPLGSL